MNVLDSLIKIKKSAQDDDLLKILEELSIYEKLSLDEQLKDLKNSKITRTKCPLLAKFADGELYETILASLAANVYLQIEGTIPQVLTHAEESLPKRKKQMDILQQGIKEVEYRDLTEYDHARMKYFVAGVFTKQSGSCVTAAIVVKDSSRYVMYHGAYTTKETGSSVHNINDPLVVRGKKGTLILKEYSVLGNNGYPFASYEQGSVSWDVMIDPQHLLYLVNGSDIRSYPISLEDRNCLGLAKKDPKQFADTLLLIIEEVVQ